MKHCRKREGERGFEPRKPNYSVIALGEEAYASSPSHPSAK